MNSYIEQLTRPMIMIKVPSMTKLPRLFNIMLFEGVLVGTMVFECILYFELPNQYHKCYRFGHLA
jgi:hypothetical protein